MDREIKFGLACGGTIFYLLGGVYLAAKTEYEGTGGAFILIGACFLFIALNEGVKSTER